MIMEIKATLLNNYSAFVATYGEPDPKIKSEIEEKIKVPVRDLFSRQRVADLSKKALGKADFDKAISLYLNGFVSREGLNHEALLRDLGRYENTLKLHLKDDALRFLRLVAEISMQVDNRPKGLLI